MNNEKFDYLKRNVPLSTFDNIRLFFLKSRGVNQNDLDKAEYEMRFKTYQKGWEKTWKNLDWGSKEDESLPSFADSALTQALNSENEKSKSR